MRDGNEGMDLSINLRRLWPGDNPNSLCGGETLFRFGEAIFTPPIGEQLPLRMSGVSSFCSTGKFFSRDNWGCRKPDFLSDVFRQGDVPTATREGRGGFPLDRNGALMDDLQIWKGVMCKPTSRHSFSSSWTSICWHLSSPSFSANSDTSSSCSASSVSIGP